MSAKISSSLARGSGAPSATGSPMCFWTRVVVTEVGLDVLEDLLELGARHRRLF